MSAYDPYESRERRRHVREERREDPRYAETYDSHLKVYSPSRDLVMRPHEDSDLSVEEIRRDFPPPGHGSRDVRRARSAEPGYYDDYDYDSRRGHDREHDRHRSSRKAPSSVYHEEEEKSRRRVLSKQDKIIAAVAGAALALGGKEAYDRYEAKDDGGEVQRNYLASAALGAAGALAGYQGAGFYNKHTGKEEKKSTYIVHRGRDGKVSEYYSDEEADTKEKKGSKSFLENALAASGLGVAVKALTGGGGKDDDKRSRKGSPDSKGSRSKSRGPGGDGGGTSKIQKAAMASLIAGATEAFRVAKEPGGWKGEKTKRILTAAAGAATIDAAHDSEKSSKLGLAESVIGGLVGNRVINGSKKRIEEDPNRPGRSRSRSRAKSDGGGGASGLAALATAGLGAFGAKKLVDHHREKSRERSRRRSADSRDSRDGSPDKRHRSRSRSVVDSARRRLAQIGFGTDPDKDSKDSRRRDQDDFEDRGSSRHHRGHSDDRYDDDYSPRGNDRDRDRDRGDRDRDRDRERGGDRGGRDSGRDRDHDRDEYDDDRSYRSSRHTRSRSRRRGKDAGSESDLGDSSEDEKRAKKMKDRRY